MATALLCLSVSFAVPDAPAAPTRTKPAVQAAKSKTKKAKRKKPKLRKKAGRRPAGSWPTSKSDLTRPSFTKRLPDWTWVARGVIALGALGMLWSWRRKDQLASSPERDMRVVPRTPAYGAHVPRAVVLNVAATPDPSTMMQDVTIDQFGAPKPAAEAPDNANAKAAADLDAIVTSIHLQQKNSGSDASVQSRRASGLTLPVELSRHFEGLPGETMVWTAPFNVPLYASGVIAITSQRVLSLYRKQQWRLMPPGYETQVRRHQMQRGRDLKAEETTVRRPSFLVAAVVCVGWFPYGTAVAALGVVLHIVAGRRELALSHKQIKRLYPLAPADITAAIAACQQASTDASSNDVAAAPPQAS